MTNLRTNLTSQTALSQHQEIHPKNYIPQSWMNPNYRIRNIVGGAERCSSNIQIFSCSSYIRTLTGQPQLKASSLAIILCIWIESSLTWTPRSFAWPQPKTLVFGWIQWDSNGRGCQGETRKSVEDPVEVSSEQKSSKLTPWRRIHFSEPITIIAKPFFGRFPYNHHHLK